AVAAPDHAGGRRHPRCHVLRPGLPAADLAGAKHGGRNCLPAGDAAPATSDRVGNTTREEGRTDPQLEFLIMIENKPALQPLGGMPGREAEAFAEFRTFLQRAPGAPKRLRDEAEKQLGRLKPSVGRLAISTTPEGAQVIIDGSPAGASPFAETVVVAPGVHRL